MLTHIQAQGCHLELVVDDVALEQVLLSELVCPLLCVIPPLLLILFQALVQWTGVPRDSVLPHIIYSGGRLL